MKKLLLLSTLAIAASSHAAISFSTFYTDAENASSTSSFSSGTLTLTSGAPSGGSTVGAISALSESVTLDDIGDFIEVTATVGGDSTNRNDYYRFGFFDTSAGAITSNFDADMDSAIGLFGTAPYRTSGSGNRGGFFNQGSGTASFLGAAGTDIPGGGITEALEVQDTTGFGGIRLRLERVASGGILMELKFPWTNDATPYTHTIASANVPSYTFDSVAFATDTNAGNSVTFSNVTVSAVPEPSTFALLAGMGALGFILYRRRQS